MLTEELCFDYVIRFRGNIAVTATTGETRTAARLGAIRRTRLRAARRRGHRRSLSGGNRRLQFPGPRHDEQASVPSPPAAPTATAKHLIGYYARRWGIECGLRDTKDLRFGMGLGAQSMSNRRSGVIGYG